MCIYKFNNVFVITDYESEIKWISSWN